MAPSPQKPETGEVREGTAAAVWTPLAEVLEWPANPKDHTGEHVDRILASIERFGWLEPIVANVPTKMIVSGHGRRLAALKRGDVLVPVRWVTLTAEEAELAAIAANRLQEIAGYDDRKLAEVLRKHADKDREGLRVAGFNDDELAAALARSFDAGAVRPIDGWPNLEGRLTHQITFYFTDDEKRDVLAAVEAAVKASGKEGTGARGSVLADMARAWMAANTKAA